MNRILNILKCILLAPAVLPQGSMAQEFCKATKTDGLLVIELPEGSFLEFTDQRPTEAEALLCIPAAFITPEGTIQGGYMIDGKMHNSYNAHSKVSLDGRSFTLGPHFTTRNGFQQMCLVRNRQPVHFRDPSRRIRRALCKLSDQSPAIVIESLEPLTMNEFARKLSTRVQYAVYTDVGSHGFGWYCTSGTPTYLSPLYFYKQKRQTNWLVCRRAAPERK